MLEKCDPVFCSQIRNIGRQFCSSLDLKCIDWQGFFQHLSSLDYDDCECHQDELLNSTIECGLVLKYPIRKAYQLAFLKYYISQIENFNIPFSRAYELYIKLLNTNSSEEEIHYKHYFIGEKVLSVQENNNFISSGTTGLRTWEAGIALANWCHSHPELLCSKEVLELGCGSGLTGITVINSALPPTKYIFTDYHPLVLQQLKHNLDINIPGEGWPRNSSGTLVDVCEFNWEDVTEKNLRKFRNADIFLAADVVYDKVLIGLLCTVLDKLLESPGKCAVLACTVRNQDTIDCFINNIKDRGLILTEDTAVHPVVIEEKSTLPVNIYIIKKIT